MATVFKIQISKKEKIMSIVNMSVHRGLAELKLYSNKIETSLRNLFVLANKNSNKTIGGRSISEVESNIRGNFDSVVSLIENRKLIKDAIVKSNATTKVTVGGKEMTVAEAIERKTSVELDLSFLNNLQSQFNHENSIVQKMNDELPTKLENYLQATLGEKPTTENIVALTKVFEDNNKFILIDPARIQNYIAKLEKETDEFITQVDYILSESNAKTFFDVELKD